MYSVSEQKDESITVYLNGREVERFLPETNLHKSVQLMSIFNNIKTIDGRKIYELWESKGFWYYAAFQEWLYWDFFVGVVQHKTAREFLRGKQSEITTPPYYVNGRLRRLNNLLYKRHSIFERIALNILCNIIRCFRRKAHFDVLLHDDGQNGFRYQHLKKTLRNLKVKFWRIEYPSPSSKLSLLLRKNILFCGGKKLRHQSMRCHFDYSSIGELQDYVTESEFYALIDAISERCENAIYETGLAIKDLKAKRPKIFITYDQIERVLPLVIACRLNRIKVLAYQHGPLTEFHAGWLGYGIPRVYCNAVPDCLVTWGPYWRKYLSSRSNKFTERNTIVGAHLNKNISYESFSEFYDARLRREVDVTRIKILVPFEFLADNIAVSRYLEIFLDHGWCVYIKLRPSEGEDTASDKYSFSKKVRKMSIFVYELNDTELSSFSAVVCTQSVFAVEMMRFSVPIWFLETRVPFLGNLIEAGIAHSLTLPEARRLDREHALLPFLMPAYNRSHYREIFSDISMTDFLSSQLEDIVDRS